MIPFFFTYLIKYMLNYINNLYFEHILIVYFKYSIYLHNMKLSNNLFNNLKQIKNLY